MSLHRPLQPPSDKRGISKGARRAAEISHRYLGGSYTIKLTSDSGDGTGDGLFVFPIPEDLGFCSLRRVNAWVTTTAGGDLEIDLRKTDGDIELLDPRITIDSGTKNSKDAAVAPVVDPDNAKFEYGDEIAVIYPTTGAIGLGVHLEFY